MERRSCLWWLVGAIGLVFAACSGSAPFVEPGGVWWPPEEPRQPGRLTLSAPDEADPLAWWRLNVYSLVPPQVYGTFRQSSLAAGIVDETNLVRARYGLEPVTRDSRLDAVAQAHAIDCATRDYWAHRTPEGLSSRDRIRAATGIEATAGAENSTAWPPGQATAREIVRAWELSPGHRALLLNPAVRFIGVGVYTFSPDELEHVVQLLVDLPS